MWSCHSLLRLQRQSAKPYWFSHCRGSCKLEEPCALRETQPHSPLDGGGAGQLQSGLDLTEGPGWGGGRRGQRMRKRGRQGWGVPRHPPLPPGSGTDQERKRWGEACEGKGQARLGEGLWAQSPAASPWSPRAGALRGAPLVRGSCPDKCFSSSLHIKAGHFPNSPPSHYPLDCAQTHLREGEEKAPKQTKYRSRSHH